jgi:hypothetical protein
VVWDLQFVESTGKLDIATELAFVFVEHGAIQLLNM